jgi:hypothetical protein
MGQTKKVAFATIVFYSARPTGSDMVQISVYGAV